MTAVEIAAIAQPLVAALVGAGQIAVVWYAIRAMIGANQDRADGAAEAARQADQRHAETMTALQALIERTAPRQEEPTS